MAKIKRIEFSVNDRDFEAQLEFTAEPVVYDIKKESATFFYVQLTEDMKTSFNHLPKNLEGAVVQFRSRGKSIHAIKGATDRETVARWEKFLEHYTGCTTSVEKVIIYTFEYSSRTVDVDPETEFFGDEAAKLEFEYMVVEKRTFGEAVNYYDIESKERILGNDNIRDEIKGTNEWIELPYSQEAEDFMSGIYSSMEELMKKFSLFIGNASKMQQAIINKQLKQLNPSTII